MIQTLCVLLAAGLMALQGKPNSDLKYDEKAGMSIQKPPKNDEWDFKEMGEYAKNPKFVVSHKVDEIMIEIIHIPPPIQGVFDNKKQAETDLAGWAGIKGITEVKQVSMAAGKLPLGGGNGANAWTYEVSFKAAEKPVELHEWVFIGKENQCQYIVMLHGDPGMYKKHQKNVDFILGQIRTYKIPK
ncbi:MAG TPA: hypothetical protein VKW04_14415 [Planctomycetota bacterium]|nr:hypothetical protein [Planctomycetota bacterium]